MQQRIRDHLGPLVLLACIARPMIAIAILVITEIPDCYAETYPNRPIRWIVPFPAGSLLDVRARFVAQQLTPVLTQRVVVDNQPGAGGIIGTQVAAVAPPDGYTIALGTVTTLAIQPALYPKLPYEPLRDFAPAILIASGPLVLLVNSKSPVSTVAELIALARSNPGAVVYASIGNGSSQHVAAELFKHLTGTDLKHVPYKQTGAAVVDLLAGRVDVMFESQPVVEDHIRAGRLKALAVTEAIRSPGLPHVPTLRESGVAGYEYSGWNGAVLPAKTPASAVARLHDAIAQVLARRETQENFKATGSRVGGGTTAEFAAHVRAEVQKWRHIVDVTRIRAD